MGASVFLTLLLALEWLSLLLGCLVKPRQDSCHLPLLHLVVFCLAAVSWRPALFRRRHGGGVALGEMEGAEWWPGGEEGRETVEIYRMREESIFNNK